MRFGLKDEVIAEIQQVLEKFPEIDEAILYGSRAKGTFREGSDIDLTLKGPSLDLLVLNRIRSELDDLNTPYTFDLSIYSRIENAELLEHIQRVGQQLYRR